MCVSARGLLGCTTSLGRTYTTTGATLAQPPNLLRGGGRKSGTRAPQMETRKLDTWPLQALACARGRS